MHDVHGKRITEEIVETCAEALRDFFSNLTGSIHVAVAVELGTQSSWLYEILKSHINSITVTDNRDNKRYGNKNDRIDAHKLANWLRLGELKKVYQGDRSRGLLRLHSADFGAAEFRRWAAERNYHHF